MALWQKLIVKFNTSTSIVNKRTSTNTCIIHSHKHFPCNRSQLSYEWTISAAGPYSAYISSAFRGRFHHNKWTALSDDLSNQTVNSSQHVGSVYTLGWKRDVQSNPTCLMDCTSVRYIQLLLTQTHYGIRRLIKNI